MIRGGSSGRGLWCGCLGGSGSKRGALPHTPRPRRLTALPRERQWAGWALGTVGIAGLALTLTLFRSSLALPGTLLVLLLGVVIVAGMCGLVTSVVLIEPWTLAVPGLCR